jgi:hypothetical protein
MPANRRYLHTLLLASGLCTASAHAIDLRDYFPTPAGATWVYSFSEWSPTARCTGRRRITVQSAAGGRLKLVASPAPAGCPAPAVPSLSGPIETLVMGDVGYRLLAREDLASQPEASFEWVPSMLVLPNRAELYQTFRSSGYVRRSSSDDTSMTYQATLKVAAVEKLEVPAGTFVGTLRLQLIEVRDTPPPSARVELRTDRWLARGVGVLKTKAEVFVDGKVVQSTQFQLSCSTLTDVQSARCVTRGSRAPSSSAL